jgi:hypothetical protein
VNEATLTLLIITSVLNVISITLGIVVWRQLR